MMKMKMGTMLLSQFSEDGDDKDKEYDEDFSEDEN